jgi:hypothetical protein
MMSDADEPGLSLVRGVTPIRARKIITERVSGMSDGRLYQLKLIARKYIKPDEIESTDEEAQGEGMAVGYPTDDLNDGFYKANSTCDERTVFFEIAGGAVVRTFPNERRTLQELKRA